MVIISPSKMEEPMALALSQSPRASTQDWLASLAPDDLALDDLDEAFLDNLGVLREALSCDPLEGLREIRRRLDGIKAMAKRLPADSPALCRLAAKAKALEALLAAGKRTKGQGPLPGDRGTPATRVRLSNHDPVAHLAEVGFLDDAHLAAAHRLRRVVEEVTRPVMARAPRLDGMHGMSRASGAGRVMDMMPGEIAVEHARHYLPWAREVGEWVRRGRYRPLDLVMDVVIMEVGLEVARRKHHCALETARLDVREALALYAKRLGLGRYRRGR
jgi:hypothetical protein